jgi:hypothetical protein
MPWNYFVSYFFGGLFLTNAFPHLVAGTMGRPFQSPFANPRGEGYSSSAMNASWGMFNAIVGYVLLFQVGNFDVHNVMHVGPPALAALLGSQMLARSFGRFNGGNDPAKEQAANSAIRKGA